MGVEEKKSFGPYSIVGRLGVGGMGVVLDARDPSGRSVALKLLRPAGDAQKYRAFAARFHREAKILKKLSHPGVVRLLDSGTIHGIFYLAMERIEGKSLGALMKSSRMDATAIIALGIKLGETLAHLHEIGVVHRDIKPDNVIIDRQGQPILTDFGLARVSGGTAITRANELVGSLGYIAPEVIEGAAPSAKSDQYALGRMLFNLSMKQPFEEREDLPILEALKESMHVPWESFPSEPIYFRLGEAIRRAIAVDPEARFPDMYSMTVELEAHARILREAAELDTVPTDKFAAVSIPRIAKPRAETQSAPPEEEAVPLEFEAPEWEDDTHWDPDAERKLAQLHAQLAERSSAPWLATELFAPAGIPESPALDWMRAQSSIRAVVREEEPMGIDTDDLVIKLRRHDSGLGGEDKMDRIARLKKKTKRFWVEQLKVSDTIPPEAGVEPPIDALHSWQHIVEDLLPPKLGKT